MHLKIMLYPGLLLPIKRSKQYKYMKKWLHHMCKTYCLLFLHLSTASATYDSLFTFQIKTKLCLAPKQYIYDQRMEKYKTVFSNLVNKRKLVSHRFQLSANCRSHLLGSILQVEQWLTAPLEEESQLVLFRGCLFLALRTWRLIQHLVENSAI